MLGVVDDNDGLGSARAEFFICSELIPHVEAADGEEAGFDVVCPDQAPGGHGDAANDGYLGGGGWLVLGFDGIEQSFEIGDTFAVEDQVAGGEAVLDAVEADGGASVRGFGAGAFLGVLTVGCDLGFGCHGGSSVRAVTALLE